MRLQLCLLLAFLAVSIAQKLTKEENADLQKNCGRKGLYADNVIHKVLNGPVANRSVEAPWVVGIDGALCSGTLISKRHVLLAAHCVAESQMLCNRKTETGLGAKMLLKSAIVTIHDSCMGPDACNREHISGRIISIKPVKMYVPNNFVHYYSCDFDTPDREFHSDIAILELETEVNVSVSLYPACLSDSVAKVGSRIDMFGYGADLTDNNEEFGILKHHVTYVHNYSKRYTTVLPWKRAADYLFTDPANCLFVNYDPDHFREQIIFMESFKKNTEPILDQYRELVNRLKYTGRLNDENFAHFRTELESLVKQLLEFDNTWTNSLRRLPKTLGKRFLNKATTVKVQIIKLVKLSGGDVEERELSPVSARKVTKSQLKSGQYVRREILPEQYQDDSRIKNNKRQAEVKKMKSKNTAAAQNLETTRIKQEIPEMSSPVKKHSRSLTDDQVKTTREYLKKEDAPKAVQRRTRSSIAAMPEQEQMEVQTPQERRIEDTPSGLEAEAIQQEERLQGKRGRKLKRALPPKKQISIIPAGRSISMDTMSISSHPDDWDTTNSEFVIYKPKREADKQSYENVKNKASASKMATLDSNGNNYNLPLFNVKQEVDESFEMEENTNDRRFEPERQENQLQLELEDESDGPSCSTSKSSPPKKKTSKRPVVRATPTPVAQKPEGRYSKKRAVESKEAVNEPVTRNSFGRIVKNIYFGDQVIYSDDESEEEEENDDEDDDEPAPKKRRISSAKLAEKPKKKIRRSIKPTQIKGATNTELLLASVKQEIAFGHEVEESEDESCDDDMVIDVKSTEPAKRRKKTKSPPVVDPTLVLVPVFKTPETITEFFEQQLYNNALVYMESFRLNFLNVMTDEGKLELQFVSDVMVDLDKGVAELLKKNYNNYLNYKPLVEAGFKKYLEYVVEEQRNLLAGQYTPAIGLQQVETATVNVPTNPDDGSPVNVPNISVKIEVE